MKTFIKENWFRLMTGTSMLIFSISFLIYATSPSYANLNSKEFIPESNYTIVPVNADGSINIRLSEEQLNEIKPPAIQSVDLNGWNRNGRSIAFYDEGLPVD